MAKVNERDEETADAAWHVYLGSAWTKDELAMIFSDYREEIEARYAGVVQECENMLAALHPTAPRWQAIKAALAKIRRG